MISFKDLPEQSGDPHVFQPVYSGHYHQRTAGKKKKTEIYDIVSKLLHQ